MSASIAFAARPTDECAPDEVTMIGRTLSYDPLPFCRQRQRAAIRAERLPAVPPLTNTPALVVGKFAKLATHCNA